MRYHDLFNPLDHARMVTDIQRSPWIVIDIETSRKFPRNLYKEDVYTPGLDPFLSRIVMVQIKTPKEVYIIDARQFPLDFLKPVLENHNILKIGHNLKFEGYFFLVHLNARINNVWDTMIVDKVLHNGTIQSYSLAALAKRYLDRDSVSQDTLFDSPVNKTLSERLKRTKDTFFLSGQDFDEDQLHDDLLNEITTEMIDKSTRLGFVNIGDRPFTTKEIEYGAEDVELPYQIYLKQLEMDIPIGAHIENKMTQVLAFMQYNGIYLDPIKWTKVYEQKVNVYLERKKQLDDYIIKEFPEFRGPSDLFSETATCAINWGSSKQVIDIFKKKNACPKEVSKATKRLEYTVGAKALFKSLTELQKEDFQRDLFPEIKTFNDFTLAYLVYKKTEQLVTTFGKDFLQYIHPITGRMHPNYNQYMNTGRLSTNKPSCLNIPRGKEYRDCFTGSIIACDFSSQESRILADISNVPSLVSFFKDGHAVFGDDMHSFAATNMYRVIKKDPSLIITKKTDPTARNVAKALNFALSYGASEHSLKDTLSTDVESAKTFIQAYFDGFPGLEKDFKKTKELAVKRGWIFLDTLGKKYYYPYFDRMQDLKREAWLLSPNYREMSQEEREAEKIRLKSETNWSQIWKEYMVLKGQLERRALNYRIQGLAATMTKIALIKLYDLNKKIILAVHDEILVEGQESDAELVRQVMIESGKDLCKNVPMDAETAYGDHWIH
jgi:DNA polymerase I-like protein with 3'-5' exonuclease and polymerase domains